MKITIDADPKDIMTIPEVIKRLGVERLCETPTDDPFVFRFADDCGGGVFNLASGEIRREDGCTRDCYATEFGAYSLAEALDVTDVVFGRNESGETVALCIW